MTHRIEIQNLTGTAGQLSVSVSHLQFEQGKTSCVIGRSGSGKSLFAAALSGLQMHELNVSGEIFLDGQRHPVPLWHDHVFVLPQEPAVALDPTMEVGQQLDEILYWRRDPACSCPSPGCLFKQVGLNKPDLAKFPEQLSGGMQQRVMIAMALAARASFVVADEPTKGLDTDNKTRVINLFKMIKATGRGLIVITHDLDVARALADEVIVFDQGSVVERGMPDEILRTPQNAEAKTLIQNAPENWPDHPNRREQKTKPILSLKDVSFRFAKDTDLINNASIDFCGGQIVGLYGPSGVGKSTLADMCLGLHSPTKGAVEWFGAPVTRALIHQHRPKFQKLFQNPLCSFPPNLILGDVFEKLTPVADGRHLKSELMSRLKLEDVLLNRRPDQVSGGELQRLAIVRSILARPHFLVCDEPSSRLDMSIQRLAIDIITDYATEHDAAVLLISHDKEILRKRADHIYALAKDGMLVRL
ncbi:peptide/nickel transport system ATP-binding protein [Aliiroseovarius halocynthiae]|uniref:ABC transporter ATP-binding protein n=1 Tax=Aliiroseovarius halocynthiae TaxID=985055 RepID=A0A545SNC1_9RHOB|nr:ATP-binding cassette domain-containing protein [Aliiroseovarius halocynthiae]TQV66469.1 ABC transporter ATP-binding protein [Aliiroseovarius halocynthiae]SMR83619.1 peptide/nickel transport system ATP-binding protein [Aliiroseovarius halocynthiae]